jgi:urea transport system substrate-binding protein
MLCNEEVLMGISRRGWLRSVFASAAVLAMTGYALAEDTIKVGILHSLSGTMAISETILKDVMLMQIADLNAKGGLLGKKVEPVVVDPASNWPLFAEKASSPRTRSRPCSDAGLRYRANPSCQCSRR